MATLPVFSLGQSASASEINRAFQILRDQGNDLLSNMSDIQLTTLVDYQRRLSALNARQARAARVQNTDVLTRFLVSDFNGIDQGQTTATVRADTATASLRERRAPNNVLVSSTSFTATTGTVESIDSKGMLFSVYSPSGVPVGTFNLTLASVTDVSLLTIDISAMASVPSIDVAVSESGLTWTTATRTALSGYRLNVWLPKSPTKFIRLVLTPSHPDDLGGSTYTFGITDVSGTSVDYNLSGDLVFLPAQMQVRSSHVRLSGDGGSGLTYYLTLSDGVHDPVHYVGAPGAAVDVPGVLRVSQDVTATNGVLGTTLPADYVRGTLQVTDSSGEVIPAAENLEPDAEDQDKLLHAYVSMKQSGTWSLAIVPAPAGTPAYNVSYLSGPAEVKATLRVHLSTTDPTQTPVFRGAYLEEIS